MRTHVARGASPSHDGPTPSPGIHLQVYPSTLVGASRITKIANGLQLSCGFSATHVVGVRTDDLPEWESLSAGVTVHRLRGTGRRGNLGRVLRVATWQPRVFAHYRRQRLAVVAAHNVWVLPLCWLLARATSAPLVYNAHELETETYTMRGPKKWAAKTVERLLVRRCRVVSVVNSPIAEWYTQRYRIPTPVVVGNVPIVRRVDVRFRETLGVRPDEMLYVHTGHLTEGRNIPLILRTFAGSRHHVAFLGDGHLRPEVVAAAERHPNIHWVPPVHPDLVVAHVREADVGLCLIETTLDLSDRWSSPNKLFEALAAGVPALCSELGEARKLLGHLADQWILPHPDSQLEAAIDRIDKLDVAAFAEHWTGTVSWEHEVAPLVTAYRQLTPHESETLDNPATTSDKETPACVESSDS